MRGDIYRLRANKHAHGHEQRGTRYAVVVQADYLNLSTLLVAPTSTSARPSDFRPTITIDGTETRLGDFAGRLDAEELTELDRALALVLGLF